MKRKQIMKIIPKLGIGIIGTLTVILIVAGIYRDNSGEYCKGLMGAKISCIEESLMWPFGFIAIPLFLFFVLWWISNYMSNTTEPVKYKKSKTKNKF